MLRLINKKDLDINKRDDLISIIKEKQYEIFAQYMQNKYQTSDSLVDLKTVICDFIKNKILFDIQEEYDIESKGDNNINIIIKKKDQPTVENSFVITFSVRYKLMYEFVKNNKNEKFFPEIFSDLSHYDWIQREAEKEACELWKNSEEKTKWKNWTEFKRDYYLRCLKCWSHVEKDSYVVMEVVEYLPAALEDLAKENQHFFEDLNSPEQISSEVKIKIIQQCLSIAKQTKNNQEYLLDDKKCFFSDAKPGNIGRRMDGTLVYYDRKSFTPLTKELPRFKEGSFRGNFKFYEITECYNSYEFTLLKDSINNSNLDNFVKFLKKKEFSYTLSNYLYLIVTNKHPQRKIYVNSVDIDKGELEFDHIFFKTEEGMSIQRIIQDLHANSSAKSLPLRQSSKEDLREDVKKNFVANNFNCLSLSDAVKELEKINKKFIKKKPSSFPEFNKKKGESIQWLNNIKNDRKTQSFNSDTCSSSQSIVWDFLENNDDKKEKKPRKNKNPKHKHKSNNIIMPFFKPKKLKSVKRKSVGANDNDEPKENIQIFSDLELKEGFQFVQSEQIKLNKKSSRDVIKRTFNRQSNFIFSSEDIQSKKEDIQPKLQIELKTDIQPKFEIKLKTEPKAEKSKLLSIIPYSRPIDNKVSPRRTKEDKQKFLSDSIFKNKAIITHSDSIEVDNKISPKRTTSEKKQFLNHTVLKDKASIPQKEDINRDYKGPKNN